MPSGPCAALQALAAADVPDRPDPDPREAMRAAERAVKAIYIHSHMDEETFDIERAPPTAATATATLRWQHHSGVQPPTCCIAKEGSATTSAPRRWNERADPNSHPSLAAHRELNR